MTKPTTAQRIEVEREKKNKYKHEAQELKKRLSSLVLYLNRLHTKLTKERGGVCSPMCQYICPVDSFTEADWATFCGSCGQHWPCHTAQVLKGSFSDELSRTAAPN
jgi:hypothetical protein